MSIQDDAKPNLRFRFLRRRAMPWVTSNYTELFDQSLNASWGGHNKTIQNYSIFFAEGALCHDGFNEALMLGHLEPTNTTRKLSSGEECSVLQAVANTGNMTMCVGKDGVPREMNITENGDVVGSSNAGMYHVVATFADINTGPLPADAFAAPGPCSEGEVPATCPRRHSDPSEDLTVLRWNHDAGKNCGLNSKMTNDLRGALTFGTLEGTAEFWDYVQVYNVSVDRRFAPMQDCNYDPKQKQSVCTGGHRTVANAKHVGRSSSQYLTGPYAGQCAENALVGSWYQFPSEGECASGWDLGFAGCTWKTRAFKLIESKCLVTRCAEIQRREEAPYPLAIACLKEAIAACPDQRGVASSTCFSRPAVLV